MPPEYQNLGGIFSSQSAVKFLKIFAQFTIYLYFTN